MNSTQLANEKLVSDSVFQIEYEFFKPMMDNATY
jgi:hypothetical protein